MISMDDKWTAIQVCPALRLRRHTHICIGNTSIGQFFDLKEPPVLFL
jgi:hypothetical protein